MTFENDRAPFLCYCKLCASFRSHWWIQTGVTVRKRLIWVKINDFLSRVTWNLAEDLQKQQVTSSMLLYALCVISEPLVNSKWSYNPETPNLGQIRRFLGRCDLEIWRMTLQNNRAPLLCYFKLCASFRSHWRIETSYSPETPNLGEIWGIQSRVILKFDGWPWKTIGHLF